MKTKMILAATMLLTLGFIASAQNVAQEPEQPTVLQASDVAPEDPDQVITHLDNSKATKLSMEFFPNPATDNVTITHTGLNKISDLIIVDLVGNVMLRKKIEPSSKSTIIDLNRMQPGLYLIKLNDQTQKLKVL